MDYFDVEFVPFNIKNTQTNTQVRKTDFLSNYNENNVDLLKP